MYLDWEAMCALIPDLYIMGCVRASLFVGLTLTRFGIDAIRGMRLRSRW